MSDVSFKVNQMRDIRHDAVWPTMALCVVLLPAYLYIALREYRISRAPRAKPHAAEAEVTSDFAGPDRRGGGCDTRNGWVRFVRLSTFFVAFLVWMTASGSVTLSGTCQCFSVAVLQCFSASVLQCLSVSAFNFKLKLYV